MKTRIATALSVAGVLFAGSAAALVNTQVLSGHDAVESTSVLETPSSVPAATTAPVAVTVASSAASATVATTPASSAAATVATSGPATTPPTTPAATAYQVGEAGLVTLLASGGTLTLVAAEPAPGWELAGADVLSPTAVRILFRTASVEVQFDASLGADGAIVTAVEARTVAAPAGTAPSVPTSVEDRDDDRKDDDRKDDDRDDDRDEDDDEDDDRSGRGGGDDRGGDDRGGDDD